MNKKEFMNFITGQTKINIINETDKIIINFAGKMNTVDDMLIYKYLTDIIPELKIDNIKIIIDFRELILINSKGLKSIVIWINLLINEIEKISPNKIKIVYNKCIKWQELCFYVIDIRSIELIPISEKINFQSDIISIAK